MLGGVTPEITCSGSGNGSGAIRDAAAAAGGEGKREVVDVEQRTAPVCLRRGGEA